MKKMLSLFLLTCILQGCSVNDENLSLTNECKLENLSLRTYPSNENWENLNNIKLPSGSIVNLPWSPNEISTDIPKDIREDIQSKDGWTFVFSNINNSVDPGNYIVFYNKFTGILKGFYYLENYIQQNNGIWSIKFEGTNKLLNGVDHFTVPIQSYFPPIQSSTVLNISNNNTRGFCYGWNCFQTYLTFDPTYNLSELKLSISTYNQNTGTITLNGALKSSSKGSIVSTTSTGGLLSNITNGIITQTGESGKTWIGEQFDKKAIKNLGLSALTGGVPSLVSYGLNSIFGSFIGSSSSTNLTQSLQFSTNGSITMSGNTSLPTTGVIPPKSNILIDSEERLGAWNLENDPIFYLNRYTTIPGSGSGTEPIKIHSGYYEYPGIIDVDYKIKLNPSIENNPQLESWSETSEIVRYEVFLGKKNSVAIMPSGTAKQVSDTSDNSDRLIFMDDTTTQISRRNDSFLFYWSASGRPGDVVDLSNSRILKGDHVLKVTVKFNININGVKSTIYSTKTFRPKYEWGPIEGGGTPW